jgi:hypothetical protein
MFVVHGPPQKLCQGWSRRAFLEVGALGGLSLALPALAHNPSPRGSGTFGKARRCLLLFLTGGPPQLDTFDPKPAAPLGIRGELRPIATRTPGMQLSELFPRLAQQSDRFCLLRSVTHGDAIHVTASYSMLTGATHPAATPTVPPSPHDHPHFGSVVSLVRGTQGHVPPFVGLPEVIKDAGVNEFLGQGAGLLGKPYDPFRIESNAERTGFRLPDIALPPQVTAQRLHDRRLLLDKLDRAARSAEKNTPHDALNRRAFALLSSSAVRRAFRLDQEPARLRDAYGPHLFGQGCLLARRLLEAGVSLATVYWHYEGPDDSPVWDTHENNFPHLRNRLAPPTDQALASLLEDLAVRGLLADTLVICMGEFGRSPQINPKGGREHWPHVQSILLAGAGLRGGSIFGSSDRHGGQPRDLPVTPAELTATFLHLLGVPPETEYRDRVGQPLRAYRAEPVAKLLA